jgi:hypothetical protein
MLTKQLKQQIKPTQVEQPKPNTKYVKKIVTKIELDLTPVLVV